MRTGFLLSWLVMLGCYAMVWAVGIAVWLSLPGAEEYSGYGIGPEDDVFLFLMVVFGVPLTLIATGMASLLLWAVRGYWHPVVRGVVGAVAGAVGSATAAGLFALVVAVAFA